MINYTKRNINIIAFIISLIITFFINSFFQPIQAESTIYNNEQETEKVINVSLNEEPNEEVVEYNWQIEIPTIGLKAPISNGTDSKTLEQFVGHFDETVSENGNVGLAAHNRKNKVNYFENIKELKLNDEIYYKYNGIEKLYIVDKIKIIRDTDWSYLGKTKEDKITLITCVENEPNYRLCVQGTYVKGGI